MDSNTPDLKHKYYKIWLETHMDFVPKKIKIDPPNFVRLKMDNITREIMRAIKVFFKTKRGFLLNIDDIVALCVQFWHAHSCNWYLLCDENSHENVLLELFKEQTEACKYSLSSFMSMTGSSKAWEIKKRTEQAIVLSKESKKKLRALQTAWRMDSGFNYSQSDVLLEAVEKTYFHLVASSHIEDDKVLAVWEQFNFLKKPAPLCPALQYLVLGNWETK